MFNKTSLFISIITALVATPLTANAVPTSTLKFAKGSYCTNFAGDMSEGRIFKAYLLRNQELNIHSDEAYVSTVKDSRGKILMDMSQDEDYRFKTRTNGNYTIKMKADGYSKVEFCVY